ncbi:MAG: hypothetical protein EBU34_11460 [Alphaproteobacteria bacterium]|nr:hypothetical protein [Alphaproteobacteria bacterium]
MVYYNPYYDGCFVYCLGEQFENGISLQTIFDFRYLFGLFYASFRYFGRDRCYGVFVCYDHRVYPIFHHVLYYLCQIRVW